MKIWRAVQYAPDGLVCHSLIGLYSSEEKANDAILRFKAAFPDDLITTVYYVIDSELDKDGWKNRDSSPFEGQHLGQATADGSTWNAGHS